MSPSDPRLKALQACEMSLYPSRDSLVEAVQYIESQAPLQQQDVFAMLMVYHNSLIKELARDHEARSTGIPGANVTPIFAKNLPRSSSESR